MDEPADPPQLNPSAGEVERILQLAKRLWSVPGGQARAVQALRVGLAHHPDDLRLAARLLTRRLTLADWRDGEPDLAPLIGTGFDFVFWLLLLTEDTRLHYLAAAQAFAALREVPRLPPARARAPGGRLRIGYLSEDFRRHPMPLVIGETIERHARNRFDIIGYSTTAHDGSPERHGIERAFGSRFVDLHGLDDAARAARIRADQVDILVDLTGMTSVTRGHCAILRARPAPIQVNWLGYTGTMADPSVDYIIGDPVVFGGGAAAHFTERLVTMPDTYWPPDTRLPVPPAPSRASQGLPDDAFVFVCFNGTKKLRRPTFSRWMRLLQATDGSVLWLLAASPEVSRNLRREAAECGVDPDRLVFAAFAPNDRHLARTALADLALDTLPCGAHTTGFDALRVGVPMVTCLGRSFAGRVGASLLHAAGLPELVTGDLDAYEALALDLARDRERLASLRARLAANRFTSPLFDGARFTAHLETMYRMMWDIHREGNGPRDLAVHGNGSWSGNRISGGRG